MATSSHDPAASTDPDASDDLAELSRRPGPFASLFLAPGDSAETRARLAMDRVPVPAPHAGAVVDAVDDESSESQVVVVDGASRVWRFRIADPFAFDLARFGDVPTLGPLLEARQLSATHAVVTVEHDVYGLTGFGALESSGDEEPIFEALDHLADELDRRSPELVALVGTAEALDDTAAQLRRRLERATINIYPTDDIDADLLSIADQVVRDAASLAAERLTHELAQFRQAREAGQVVEGEATLTSTESGEVQRLLIHDDLVREAAAPEPRLVDRVIRAGLANGVAITMIPDVADGRGPDDGVGGILSLDEAPAVDELHAVGDGDASVTS